MDPLALSKLPFEVQNAVKSGDYSSLSPSNLSLLQSLFIAGNGGVTGIVSSDSIFGNPAASTELVSMTGITFEKTIKSKNLNNSRIYTEITDTPESVGRNKLATYADAHKDQITQDSSGKYFLTTADGTKHQIIGFQEAAIGAPWESFADATKRCENINVTPNTCLDNVVSNYNKTRREGTRELTREDVVACNPEIFGTESSANRGTSCDGIANVVVGDVIKLPVIAEKNEFNEKLPQTDDPTPVEKNNGGDAPKDKLTKDSPTEDPLPPDYYDHSAYVKYTNKEKGSSNVVRTSGFSKEEIERLASSDGTIRPDQLPVDENGFTYLDLNGDKIPDEKININEFIEYTKNVDRPDYFSAKMSFPREYRVDLDE